ncbi:MAG TPA: hypothetical protein VFM18_12920 [Methanosarcina sp.]|nr:hypothetical protein [Methanosarcina sp.]
MALLDENIRKQLKEMLSGMVAPVKLVIFTKNDDGDCSMCADTRQLVEEVAELSDKIGLEIFDFDQDKEEVTRYSIDKVPAIAVLGGPENKDYGIRLYGIPSGYEFGTLVEDILLASRGKADLSEATLKEITKLKQPIHIQVFTTPT